MERERVTVQEAARRLGITESAVRKRVQRGLIQHDKEPDGRLYVYLDKQEIGRDEVRDSSYDMIVRRLENENEFLRRELERKDAILLNMTEAMKALSPPAQEEPSEPPGAAETAAEEPERAGPGLSTRVDRRAYRGHRSAPGGGSGGRPGQGNHRFIICNTTRHNTRGVTVIDTLRRAC